jgi:hypothetical protein
MVRDITTTYNVWNIDERNIKIADAVPGQNQELPESTSHGSKSTMGLSKSSLSAMTTVLWLQPM